MGHSVMKPQGSGQLRQRLFYLVLGGPLANVFLPVFLEIILYLFQPRSSATYLLGAFTVHVFSALSVLAGIASLLPDTDSNGEFSFALPPGRYTVRISAPGFSEFAETIDLGQTGPLQRTFTLQVAGISENVTVTESSEYQASTINSATKTYTPLRDIPQAITVVTQQQVHDQLMQKLGTYRRLYELQFIEVDSPRMGVPAQ